jgi:hypothetical protein
MKQAATTTLDTTINIRIRASQCFHGLNTGVERLKDFPDMDKEGLYYRTAKTIAKTVLPASPLDSHSIWIRT